MIRKFDWNEAKRLYASGLSAAEVAKRLGVREQAVRVATDPDFRHKRYAARRALMMNGSCVDCGKTISDRAQRCRGCEGLRRRTTITDDLLLCTQCHEWKPAAAFINDRKVKSRNGRAYWCKDCNRARYYKSKQRVVTRSA